MMTIKEVMMLADEYEVEKKAVKKVPHYYMRKGQILERSYPDYIYSDRYYELLKILDSEEAKVFKCSDCGSMVSWFDLETWICDFKTGKYTCSVCYEEYMGEDL